MGSRCYSDVASERYLHAEGLAFKIERFWRSGAETGYEGGGSWMLNELGTEWVISKAALLGAVVSE